MQTNLGFMSHRLHELNVRNNPYQINLVLDKKQNTYMQPLDQYYQHEIFHTQIPF